MYLGDGAAHLTTGCPEENLARAERVRSAAFAGQPKLPAFGTEDQHPAPPLSVIHDLMSRRPINDGGRRRLDSGLGRVYARTMGSVERNLTVALELADAADALSAPALIVEEAGGRVTDFDGVARPS
jgi:hypothetical protein